MSFKTMDGVEVYDKRETDALLEAKETRLASAEGNITNMQTAIQSLDNSKATKASVQDLENVIGATDTAGLKGRIKAVEESNGGLSSRVQTLENETITVNEINTALNMKADKSYAEQTRGIANGAAEAAAGLATRTLALENNKINRFDLATEVSNQVNDIITTKLQVVESDINHIVETKVADAVSGIPNPGVASTADVTAIVNQYF